MADQAVTGSGVHCRRMCSVCLEPYVGRQPKILPCYHTFCLSCLSELAETSQKGVESGQTASVSITCPDCRKTSPVPPGGVADFQSNFYIEDEVVEDQPLFCQLCDGSQEARYQCSKCGMVCFQCQHIHAKCCSSPQVTTLKRTVSKSKVTSKAVHGKVQNQLAVIQRAVDHLDLDMKRVHDQRQDIEEKLGIRHAEGLRRLAEARDECLKSLVEASETVKGKLQMEMKVVRDARVQLCGLQAEQSGLTEMDSSLISDTDMQKFESYVKTGGRYSLSYKTDVSHDDSFRSFLGTVVVEDKEDTEEMSGPDLSSEDPQVWVSERDVQKDHAEPASSPVSKRPFHTEGDQLSEILAKVEGLLKTVAQYDHTASMLQSELNEVKQKNTHYLSELTSLKDKNALVCQDVAMLQSQTIGKFEQDISGLKKEVKVLDDLRQDINGMKKEVKVLDDLRQDIKGMKKEAKILDDLRQDINGMKKEVKVMDDLKQDIKGMKKEVKVLDDLRQDIKFMKKEVKILDDLKQDINGMKKEMKIQDGWRKKKEAEITKTVETISLQLVKASRLVCFQALLQSDVVVKTEEVLILKDVIINTGDGYNCNTGYFTAPVSGTYMFMASSRGMEGKPARLDIVHKNKDRVAYLLSTEGSSCTCHVAVHVAVGETVWLRTFEDSNGSHFDARWMTSFSGVLVQPHLAD